MTPDPKRDDLFQKHLQEILDGIPSAISSSLPAMDPPSSEVARPVEEVSGGTTPQARDVIRAQLAESVPIVAPEESRHHLIHQVMHEILNFLKWLFGLFSRKPAQPEVKGVLVPSEVATTTNVDYNYEPSEERVEAVKAELVSKVGEFYVPDAPPGVSGTDEEQMIALMNMLAPLRAAFVCTCLFSCGSSRRQQEATVRQTLNELNGVRNTWTAQRFLIKYPHFFTLVDRKIYAEVGRRGYTASRRVPITR